MNQMSGPGALTAETAAWACFSKISRVSGSVGMAGAGDPDNRRFMQWSGYSAGQQLLLDRVKTLTSIRAQQVALRQGQRSTLSADADTLVYQMSYGADKVYVAINRADDQRSAGSIPAGSYTEVLTGAAHSGGDVQVPARQTRIFVKK